VPKLTLPCGLTFALFSYLTLLHRCGCLDMHQQPLPALLRNNRQPVIVINIANCIPPKSPFHCCCCNAVQQQLFPMLPPFDCNWQLVDCRKIWVAILSSHDNSCCRRPRHCAAVAPAPLSRNRFIIVIFTTNVAAVDLVFVSVVIIAAAVPVVDTCCGGRIHYALYQQCCLHFIVPSAVGVDNCCFFSLSLSSFLLIFFSSL